MVKCNHHKLNNWNITHEPTLLFIEMQTPAEDGRHLYTCMIMSIKCGKIYLILADLHRVLYWVHCHVLQCSSSKNLWELPCVTAFQFFSLSDVQFHVECSIISILNSDHCSNVPEPSSSALRDMLTGVQSVFVHLNDAVPLGMPSFHSWRVSKGCEFNIKSNDQRYWSESM